jgi:hypothetical protein
MLWFLILLVIIIATGIIAFIIFLAVKFFRWVFSPITISQSVNSDINKNDLASSEQFRQFSSERVEYWNRVIKQQKSAGTFDEGKKLYEEGQYKGIKYSIVISSVSDMESEGPEADLMVQMIMFTQLHE